MNFTSITVACKDGTSCLLRRPTASDAAALIRLLKITAEESYFLLKEPEEITLTVAEEEAFLTAREDDESALMLIAEDTEGICGICSLTPIAPYRRVSHRCNVSIALLQRASGKGLGRAMLTTLLAAGKAYGYRQAELEVVEGNTSALALYQKLGFVPYGTRPDAMQYKDGTLRNEILMQKML